MTKLIPITVLTLTLRYFFGNVDLKCFIQPLKYDTDGADSDFSFDQQGDMFWVGTYPRHCFILLPEIQAGD